jgi:hypothetical protein
MDAELLRRPVRRYDMLPVDSLCDSSFSPFVFFFLVFCFESRVGDCFMVGRFLFFIEGRAAGLVVVFGRMVLLGFIRQ